MSELSLEDEHEVARGSNWFFWVAGLSLINTILMLSNSNYSMVIGLGVTQLMDGIASTMESKAATGIALGLDVVVVGFLIGIGFLSRKNRIVFLIGIILYALDSLIYVMMSDWLSVAFHAFVLVKMFAGFKAFPSNN